MKEFTWSEELGLRNKAQRGHIVKVKGKRGPQRVLRSKYPHVWVTPYKEDETLASRNRARQEQYGRIEKSGAKAGRNSEGVRLRQADVTHVAINPKPRRRRRRY